MYTIFYLALWQEDFNQTTVGHDRGAQSQSRKVLDEKLKEMKDQLIRAGAYLNFAAPDNNSHLMKELRIRIKELERAIGEATKDSDLSKRLSYFPLSCNFVCDQNGRRLIVLWVCKCIR